MADDNCFELLELADMHGGTRLKNAALAHIKTNGASLVKSLDWDTRITGMSGLLKEIVTALMS